MSEQRTGMLIKSLGAEIQRLRKAKGLSQEALGKATGTSQMTVKRLENASVGTRIDNLLEIASALEVSLASVLASIEGVDVGETVRGDDESKWAQVESMVGGMTAVERDWFANVVWELFDCPWKGGK